MNDSFKALISITVKALIGRCVIGFNARRLNASTFDFCRSCLDEKMRYLLNILFRTARPELAWDSSIGEVPFSTLVKWATLQPNLITRAIFRTRG